MPAEIEKAERDLRGAVAINWVGPVTLSLDAVASLRALLAELDRLKEVERRLAPLFGIEFSKTVGNDKRVTIGVSGHAIALCTKLTVGDIRALSKEERDG